MLTILYKNLPLQRSPENQTFPSTEIMTHPSKGRLVWNHSTHLDGLIPILEKLTYETGITTITPGVISRSKGHSPQLKLRVSVPIVGGYKLIARQGKTVQEVFIVTDLDKPQLEKAIEQVLGK